MLKLGSLLKVKFLENTLRQYFLFLIVILIGIFTLNIFKNFFLRRLKAWAKINRTDLDEFLIELFERIGLPLMYYGIFYFATNLLTFGALFEKGIKVIGISFMTIQGIRLFNALLAYGIEKLWLVSKGVDNATQKSLTTLLKIFQVIIWGAGIIFLFDNLGFKISTVLAGLGIGGAAVALAAQAILADLFSYFAIFFDKPFAVGDFVVIGEFAGTVENIGIKTTRIRSLSGEQIVFSNTDLTSSRIRNYKRMQSRRVVFKIGVSYQTPIEQLKEIPLLIKRIIETMEGVSFERAHFASFGDYSLIFEVVYHVLSQDYNTYMDAQEKINLTIKEEFLKRKIEFAYPTQTIFISKEN